VGLFGFLDSFNESVYLSLEVVASLLKSNVLFINPNLGFFQVIFSFLHPVLSLYSEVGGGLACELRLGVFTEGLHVELQVEHETGHHGGHIVKLVVLVLEVFINEPFFANRLVFPLRQELFSALPFVHHF